MLPLFSIASVAAVWTATGYKTFAQNAQHDTAQAHASTSSA